MVPSVDGQLREDFFSFFFTISKREWQIGVKKMIFKQENAKIKVVLFGLHMRLFQLAAFSEYGMKIMIW